MFVAGELRSQVHRDAAALPVIGAHGQPPGFRVDIGPDVEIPASADARNVETQAAAVFQRGGVDPADIERRRRGVVDRGRSQV